MSILLIIQDFTKHMPPVNTAVKLIGKWVSIFLGRNIQKEFFTTHFIHNSSEYPENSPHVKYKIILLFKYLSLLKLRLKWVTASSSYSETPRSFPNDFLSSSFNLNVTFKFTIDMIPVT